MNEDECSDDQKDPRDPRGGNDGGPKEFKGGVPAPVKPVETLRLRSGPVAAFTEVSWRRVREGISEMSWTSPYSP